MRSRKEGKSDCVGYAMSPLYANVAVCIWVLIFCVGFVVKAVRSCSRSEPLWSRFLTYFLVSVMVAIIGGTAVYSVAWEWKAVERQYPQLHTAAPPSHWWRGASETK